MRKMVYATLLLALLAPVRLAAQNDSKAPACRASLDGNVLTTVIEFPDGYAVEAPWQVSWNRGAALEDGRRGVTAQARLDRIVEVRPGTKERVTTPFPEPITTTFEGHSDQELAYRAAQIWCLTVLKAQEQSPSSADKSDRSNKSARRGTRVQTATP